MIKLDYTLVVTILYIVVLYAFMSRLFFKPIARVLKERRQLTEGRLQAAQQSVAEADRKAQQAKAAVYHYYFTWRSPVRDGKLRSFHTVEIPFVFDNVDAASSMTVKGADRQPPQSAGSARLRLDDEGGVAVGVNGHDGGAARHPGQPERAAVRPEP